MSDVKKALRGIPPKQPNEGPATDKQVEYLRSFGIFTERLITDLGMGQATYLIEKAIEIRESEESEIDERRQSSGGKTKRSMSSGCGFLLLLVAALLVGILWFKSGGIDDSAQDTVPVAHTESALKFPRVTKTPGPETPNATAAHTALGDASPTASPRESAAPARLRMTSFEGISLPASVVVVDAIHLLDKTGKEKPIAPGAIIKIGSRSDLGTLTMEIDGAVYVGNEDRLLSKVEAQQ